MSRFCRLLQMEDTGFLVADNAQCGSFTDVYATLAYTSVGSLLLILCSCEARDRAP